MKHFTADGHEIVVGMVCKYRESEKCVVYMVGEDSVNIVLCDNNITCITYPTSLTLWKEPAVKHDPMDMWVMWHELRDGLAMGGHYSTLEHARRDALVLKPYAIAKWCQPFSEGENL